MSAAADLDLLAWVGRDAWDPYGKRLGRITGVLRDAETGAPAWLALALDGAQPAGRALPVAGAQRSGRAVRVPQTLEAVHAAPVVGGQEAVGEPLASALRAHYAPAPPAAERPAPPVAGFTPPGEEAVQQIVTALREAHAMEQGMLKRLAAMIWALEDQELVHDLVLHHKETNDHAELLRRRLGELGSHRSSLVDLGGKLPAWLKSQGERLRHHTECPSVRDALAAERAEVKAYRNLERLAERAGDGRTAALARRIRADEEAMIATLSAGGTRYRELHRQEDGRNPFAAPPHLVEGSPRT